MMAVMILVTMAFFSFILHHIPYSPKRGCPPSFYFSPSAIALTDIFDFTGLTYPTFF